jgi:hypothetical protein
MEHKDLINEVSPPSRCTSSISMSSLPLCLEILKYGMERDVFSHMYLEVIKGKMKIKKKNKKKNI